jgi:NAD(P)-dependent dehydrogenase (short-subunit alcohol dehydrogenase family)
MSNIVVITGASSGFGALTARALADAGNTVYASMRKTTDRNAAAVQAAADYSTEHGVDLRAIEMDVNSPESVDAAVAGRGGARPHRRADPQRRPHGRRPGRGVHPEQLAELYNVNVLSTQRVNRATLPGMRHRRGGLVIWVSSSSVKGGTPPYLAPYFADRQVIRPELPATHQ